MLQTQARGCLARGAGAGGGQHPTTACRYASATWRRCATAPRRASALRSSQGQPGILVETSTQYGANTLEVTRELEHRLEVLVPALARHGVEYHPALLRPASFIESAIEKLRNSLAVGALLVVTLLLLTLRDWRGALISFSAIPRRCSTTVWILQARADSRSTP